MIAFAAHLRIYEPLGALPEAERQHWSAYVEDGAVPSRPVLMAREHDAALTAALAVPPRASLPVDDDQAYVRHLDGLTYVCPWRLQLRAWEALDEFRAMLPEELADAFLPRTAVAQAEDLHDEWVAAHQDVRIGIRSSTWSIPLPWFVLFESEERRLVLGERRTSGGQEGGAQPPGGLAQTGLDRALVYLTAMSRARRRAATALHVVRRAFEDGPAVEALEEIGRWLEDFHPHSLVELDYGGLVHLLDDETLSADDSVGDLGQALAELGRGDGEAAIARYEAVLTRWRAMAALEHAN